MPWTVENFLVTFYKCVARSHSHNHMQLTFHLSLSVSLPFLALATMATFRTHTRCRVIRSVHCSVRWTFLAGWQHASEVAGEVGRGVGECAMVWLKPFCQQHPATLLCHVQYFSRMFLVSFVLANSAQLDFSNSGCAKRKKNRAKKYVRISIGSKKLLKLFAAEVSWLKVSFGI